MAQKLDISQLEIIQQIGTGSYGIVKLARKTTTGELYALKMLKKAEILKLKQVDHVMSEFSILRSVRHPFLANMLGYTQDERFLYFALEYVPGGDLFMHLRHSRRLDITQTRLYTAQITIMLEYLHNLNIVYRDLKPENLLICSDGYLKLTDFGLAKIVIDRTYTLCGTPEYLAPEILLNKGHGKPVDWWALGIIIYEMLVGADPFSDENPMFIYQKILKGKVYFPTNFDGAAKSLVKHLLVADVGKRYGAMKNETADIKMHRWFAGFDWVKLCQKLVDIPFKPIAKPIPERGQLLQYPDSENAATPVRPIDDPFIDW